LPRWWCTLAWCYLAIGGFLCFRHRLIKIECWHLHWKIHTTYEGLKESSLKEEDTVNEAKVGKAAQTAPEKVNLEKPQDPQQREIKQVSTRELLKQEDLDDQSERGEQHDITQVADSTNNEPLEQNTPTENQESSVTAPTIEENKSETVGGAIAQVEFIVANDSSEIVLNSQPVADDIREKKIARSVSELNVSEVKMLDRKLKRWASSISTKIESKKPEEWKSNGQRYVANFRKIPAEMDMDTDEVIVEVATKRNGEKLTTSLRLKKMAFSNFAQFIHHWDTGVSIHDDEMNGRFHSNTKINLVADRHGTPMFHGKVTTASYFVDIEGRASRKDIFLAGLETGVKRISMPKPSVLFSQAHSDETINSNLIKTDSRLIFKHDGTYLVQAHKEVGVMRQYQIGDKPLYILAAPGVSLSLSGVVNGAVAVYSPRRLIIEGNLEYVDIEHIDQGGDFLGLISGRSVVIANRKFLPAGDLNIQAAIYAKNRFEVRQLTGKRVGTLNILGSVSAGTITATEPRYATNIVFDTRLENLRPPGFPVTDRYELVAKQNSWQLEEDPFYEPLEEAELTVAETDDGVNSNRFDGFIPADDSIPADGSRKINTSKVEDLRSAVGSSQVEDATPIEDSLVVEGSLDVKDSAQAEGSAQAEDSAQAEGSVDIDESSQFENYSEQ